MLLQERDYQLYHDAEREDERKSLVEQHASPTPLGLSDASSSAKISAPNSSKNGLRRSTFDLSSVNSLVSDSSSYSVPSPSRKSSTLRYRGQSSFSSSQSQDSSSYLVLQRSQSALREVREEPSEWQEDDNLRAQASTPATIYTTDLRTPESTASDVTSSDSDCMNSVVQYLLEVILLGYFVVPFLQLTIMAERYFRRSFRDLHTRESGFMFTTQNPSSSFQEEPIHFERQEIHSSMTVPVHEELSYEIVPCSSSASSSSDDDAPETDQDGWGHFADFQDELADETSFIPSCSPSCAPTLETLAESREEDDDAGDEWMF